MDLPNYREVAVTFPDEQDQFLGGLLTKKVKLRHQEIADLTLWFSKGLVEEFPYTLKPGRTHLDEALRLRARDEMRWLEHRRRAEELEYHSPIHDNWGPWLALASPEPGLLSTDVYRQLQLGGPPASLELLDLLHYLHTTLVYRLGHNFGTAATSPQPRILRPHSWHVSEQSGWRMRRPLAFEAWVEV